MKEDADVFADGPQCVWALLALFAHFSGQIVDTWFVCVFDDDW